MATLTITLNGSVLAGLTTNPSKSYTVSDADLQAVLTWAASNHASTLPLNPTNGQILLAWVQGWITGTKDAVQRFQTPAAVVPPQVTVA